MTSTNSPLDTALAAGRAAAPNLDQTALDAAITAAVEALIGQVRSMQVALTASASSADVERDILTNAQTWVAQNGTADIEPLAEILGGHRTYGFDPAGVDGLDPVIAAEAANEAYLREFARAERLQRTLDAA